MKGIKRFLGTVTGLNVFGSGRDSNIKSHHGGEGKVDLWDYAGQLIRVLIVVIGLSTSYFYLTGDTATADKLNDIKQEVKDIQNIIEPNDSI